MHRREKDISIETLRGLACLLIVLYHALPVSDVKEGVFSYSYFGYCFRLIRLPLFTAISGYVYALHPVAWGDLRTFVFGKARRILLPWFFATVVTLLLTNIFHPVDVSFINELAESLWIPLGHLWFLPAIFWVILTVALLEVGGLLSSFRSWVMVCAVAWIPAIFFMDIPPGLAVAGYFQLLPFFLFGLGLNRFHRELRSTTALTVFAICALGGIAIHQLMWFGVLNLGNTQYNVLVLVAVYGSQGLIFRFRKGLPILAALGKYSFPVYLYHLIAISIATKLMVSVHIQNIHLVLLGKMLIGLLVPVFAAHVLQRSAWLNLLFLGEKSRKRVEPASVNV